MSRLWMMLGWVVGVALLGGGSVQAADAKKAEPPRLVVQKGHGSPVNSVAFSPDGKIVASGSDDKAIKLWDVATSQELRTLAEHSKAVRSVAFSPDGKTVVSGSADKTLKLWDVTTGRELRTLAVHTDSVSLVAFSPDGKTVASGSEDKTIKLWDVITGKELRTLTGHELGVTGLAFSPDGKTLVSGSLDKTLRLWEVCTGRELHRFTGHEFRVTSAAFSPDGKTVVSGSQDMTVRLWDVATGRELHTFAVHGEWRAESAIFSPDGKTLVSAIGQTLKLWDVETGKELRIFTGHEYNVRSVAFSPDSKTLVSGGADHTLRLWDVASGRELHTLDRSVSTVMGVAFSPDSRIIAAGTRENTIKLWGVDTSQELRTLARHEGWVTSVAFSPDGKTMVSGSWDFTIKLWDVSAGRELRTFAGHNSFVESVAFSPDGNIVASGGGDGTIKLWDVATGRELHTFEHGNGVTSGIVFSPDGKIVASANHRDQTLKLWSVTTGQALLNLTGHTGGVTSVAFSPDGKTMVSGSLDKTIKLWDVSVGQELHTFAGHEEFVASVAFSPDGKTMLSGSADKTLKFWDVATGRELRSFTGHENLVKYVVFSPDGKTLVSGSWDNTLKLWRVSDGALLATLTSFTDGHWAVTDPEGRFDASNGGDNPHLHWVFENTPIDLAQLKDRYYDPGLLQKVMGFGKEPLRTVPKFEDALLHHWPEVAVSAADKNPLRLNIRLTDRGDGYGRVRVRLNGKEVTANAAAGKVLSGKTASLTLDLDPDRLLPGDNRIDVVAWPGIGHIPSPAAQFIVSGAAARGAIRTGDGKVQVAGKPQFAEPVTLHAIIMGVSQYAGPNLRLAFPGKDAADFAQAIKLGSSRLFGADRVRLHLLSDYAPAGTSVSAEHLPTRDNLRRAFETIAKEAKAGDILLVYLAGHGVMTPGAAGEAEYYYLSREAQSSDLSDPAVRKLWGVSSRELTEWIKEIKAAKQVMVLDTCSAGGAIEKLVAKRQIPGAQVIALEQLKDRTGVHILAGAAADKVSYEASQFGQGLLTYALLTGMKGAALKDEIIDVQKLFQYTRDEVPKLARQIGGIQEPRLSSPQGESFAIGRMAEDDRQKVPLAQIKPMIQRASFQDEAKMKDVIKLGQRFDDRLKLETYAAARGSMVYVDADDFPEAWQVSGRYRKEADGVRVMARLFRGEEEKGAFEVMLPLDEAGQTDALLAATVKAMGRGL